MERWAVEHVDAQPGLSTTVTYAVTVAGSPGRRAELLGATVRAGGAEVTTAPAWLVTLGDRQVTMWRYPDDPDLPGLARVVTAEGAAALLEGSGLVTPRRGDVAVSLVTYRPRRRAVVRAVVAGAEGAFFIKALRGRQFDGVRLRHRLLRDAGVPAPEIVAATEDHLLVLRELPGVPLAQAIFDSEEPCRAEDLVALLDAMPASVATLRRRPPWPESVEHYALTIAKTLPAAAARLGALAREIRDGLDGCALGFEPTHGDFHEGQVHVSGGRVCGLLDVDTVGPGRRADDLACLVGHLSTIQRMNSTQAQRVARLLRSWVPVFDARVDAAELRLRSAAVVVSLATGPFRAQQPDWEAETMGMLATAEALVRQVR